MSFILSFYFKVNLGDLSRATFNRHRLVESEPSSASTDCCCSPIPDSPQQFAVVPAFLPWVEHLLKEGKSALAKDGKKFRFTRDPKQRRRCNGCRNIGA